MRNRLIELQSEAWIEWQRSTTDVDFVEYYADHLLANGVIVPPVKVRQTVWRTDGVRLYENTVGAMTFTTRHTLWFTEDGSFVEAAIGKTVFLTREDAEKALKGGAE
jgi:hypothetical protein